MAAPSSVANPSQTPNKVAYPARHRQDTIIGPIKNAARKLSKPSELW